MQDTSRGQENPNKPYGGVPNYKTTQKKDILKQWGYCKTGKRPSVKDILKQVREVLRVCLIG